jgi:hypothetical protein
MQEPYAMKVARTVLCGGKSVMVYLSRQTLCSFTISIYCYGKKNTHGSG